MNVDEPWVLDRGKYDFPVHVVLNDKKRGFAANHNAAFRKRSGSYFCVMNPDVRIGSNPFPTLLEGFEDRTVGCVAPRVVDSSGRIENSARSFPTPASLVLKALGCEPAWTDDAVGENCLFPDWVAGMMMLFRAEAYEAVSGFDEAYHLYYEDVDICARLRIAGYKVALCPRVRVVHDARRDSHRDPRYLKWHLASMLRFLGRKLMGRYDCRSGMPR
ncbi:MAG: glycosyltransferase [Syntrophobacteraceae bacterium]